MRKIIIFLGVLYFSLGCFSQKLDMIDISNQKEMNYHFANLKSDQIFRYSLFNNGIYATIFQMSDSRATPKYYFEETDEVFESLIVSIIPDGDYYTISKLYKIQGLLKPKILRVSEGQYPKFILEVEYGIYANRKTKLFEFEGFD